MASDKTAYVCSNCGAVTTKWYGKCPSCSQWNTLVEEVVSSGKSTSHRRAAAPLTALDKVDINDELRYTTGIEELDRVLGGGIVRGSVVLIGGEPGAGKSTLLLQLSGSLAQTARVMYVSGEESARQIKLRANRLGVNSANIAISNETDITSVVRQIVDERPDIAVIDSIQTMSHPDVGSSPGSITQVRECTMQLLECAKENEIPIFIVGHVNKDGAIAGPKVMEHIVDTVLYFEGDRYLSSRVLRSAKNRFGSTNELGIFDMTDHGLVSVLNPSAALLEGRSADISGSSVCCVMEGTRPILAEVQTLIAKTSFGTARRTSSGFDYNRLNLLLAVLEKRAGFAFGALDVYINIVGGMSLQEPAVDLALVAGLVSSLLDKPIDSGCLIFGEIGLGGEVRAVQSADTRVAEAGRLGFSRCIIPNRNLAKLGDAPRGIKLTGIDNISQLAKLL